MAKLQAVIVTTEHRGVFFGYAPANTNIDGGNLTLEKARMIVYWPAQTRGVLGLTNGAPKGSRVSPAVQRIELRGVTAMWPCERPDSFEAGPWT